MFSRSFTVSRFHSISFVYTFCSVYLSIGTQGTVFAKYYTKKSNFSWIVRGFEDKQRQCQKIWKTMLPERTHHFGECGLTRILKAHHGRMYRHWLWIGRWRSALSSVKYQTYYCKICYHYHNFFLFLFIFCHTGRWQDIPMVWERTQAPEEVYARALEPIRRRNDAACIPANGQTTADFKNPPIPRLKHGPSGFGIENA